MTTLLAAATLGALALIAWHFLLWPRFLMAAARSLPSPPAPAVTLPRITLVMPAHNEAAFIARKVANLAALDYPRDRLRVVIACDGCTDPTVPLARSALVGTGLDAVVLDHPRNRGKVAVLNEAIGAASTEIVALTDVSAMLPPDALRRVAAWFADPALAGVGGTYALERPGSEGERAYWTMQTMAKRGEAALGAPLGMHGAFWAFRRRAWAPLPADTINDDFVLPMQMFLRGWKLAYDPAIVVREAERSDPVLETRRRQRIAAGNAQQLMRLLPLLHPRHGRVALAFASGKALRVAMPALVAIALAGTLALAPVSVPFALLAGCELAVTILALCGLALGSRAPKPIAVLHYAAAGNWASFVGVARYALGRERRPWRRAAEALPIPAATWHAAETLHLPRSVAFAKRGFDMAVALLALAVTLPLWPLIALAIRLDSSGPVIFRQLRIGRALADRTELFVMMKFRSMRSDAEATTGAVWATKRDPRITRVGAFLRKTRLDELPQLLNVLKGDMAIIGPRPERPGFYHRLEREIPFFADRTAGLRPGITGLAQVRQGYDSCIADVCRKVAFDHAYAIKLTDLRAWLVADSSIALRTLAVMAGGRGQ